MTSKSEIDQEHRDYRQDGYVGLPALFPREVMDTFYARVAADLNLSQNSGRFLVQGPLLSKQAIEVYGHAYPPLLNFLWGMTPRVTQVAGCALLPTYCYLRIYQQGDICRVHSDRHACEHSLSLTIALSDQQPWALSVEAACLDAPTSSVESDFGQAKFGSVAMKVGDAVMYQGVHHRHGRLEPNPNQWSAHLFLHWVDPAGPYKNQAFDRPALEQAGLSPA